MKKPFLLFILLPVLLFACSDSKSIVLWSDRQEVADAVELYNMSGTEYRVIFQYKKELVSSFFKEETKPDIIIGTDLSNSLVKNNLADLKEALKTDESFSELLMSPLISGTEQHKEFPLVPLSFSPLTAVFTKESKRMPRSSLYIEIEEMRDLGIQFNSEKKRGYSPYWDESFLLAFLDLSGAGFREDSEDLLGWNREELAQATDSLKEWRDLNGGLETMDAFDGKYMYDNPVKLLKEGRNLFRSFNLGDYMTLSDSMNRSLDFFYITFGSKLYPGTVIYGGINRNNRSIDQSVLFMKWILDKKSQGNIIASALKNSTGTFGFLGGLSSLDDVNREILVSYYPGLEGKIPLTSYIHREPEKPVEYGKIKEELLVPWLRNSRRENGETLEEALEKWKKLRIPF
ncbi:MAG: hypothetical protein JXR86_14220 [Spirochaetales bacterium]|nr:hypothetical protein [Spirochaetales bacterium]